MAIKDHVEALWPGADDERNVICDRCNSPIEDEDPVEFKGEPHHRQCRRQLVALRKSRGTVERNKQRRRGGWR